MTCLYYIFTDHKMDYLSFPTNVPQDNSGQFGGGATDDEMPPPPPPPPGHDRHGYIYTKMITTCGRWTKRILTTPPSA